MVDWRPVDTGYCELLTRGVFVSLPARRPDDNQTNRGFAEFQVAGANRRWRCQFRCRGPRRESAVAQLFSFAESACMNLQSLIVVVLRLMALNFSLQVAVQLSPQLLRFSEVSRQGGMPGMGSYLAVPVVMVIGLIVGAILIWVFALSIARFVTRGVSRDLSFGSLSLVDCYSVVFIGIGLLYIASHFPQVLNWAHYLFKAAVSQPGDRWKEGVQWYDVSSAFIPFVVGVALFVKGRSWAVALARSQEKSESANQTVERTGAPPVSSDPQ